MSHECNNPPLCLVVNDPNKAISCAFEGPGASSAKRSLGGDGENLHPFTGFEQGVHRRAHTACLVRFAPNKPIVSCTFYSSRYRSGGLTWSNGTLDAGSFRFSDYNPLACQSS